VAAPVPETARGPAVDMQKGYLVEELGEGRYWVTEVTNEPVAHVILGHSHSDRIGAAGSFGAGATDVGAS
jgi:hypothetical protein